MEKAEAAILTVAKATFDREAFITPLYRFLFDAYCVFKLKTPKICSIFFIMSYVDGSYFFFRHASYTKTKSPVVKLTTEPHECAYKNKNCLTEMKQFLGHSFLFSSLYHTKNYYGNYDTLGVYP